MPNEKITVEELAEFVQRQLPMTYDVFEENRDQDGVRNNASWARGRIDALLQIMRILDKEREAMLRSDWERVVTGEGFMKCED